ncbi:large conductance mechanosensitive channel protein MscL [Gloeocapsopsis crepidinum LEGE 06123]|uniref:Large-conductance mechanosensitive channel n=1 Tax=Gloeocapsopsis crepidinum LEGE 06123 TaxID=588587 RepID=A0ABR9UTQ7_9CHRO|nr:large conductance mechanosensitive channel protein MscL [Gloeocapsopsis crepidinum]MBE9191688.1 large conductance mechanosensitive channel protein MscL [Gloeocapsopsis crepidinum LEGE 06123]
MAVGRTIGRNRRVVTGFFRDFREFALKGNVVELAIAVIIGGAFGNIVTSFAQDIVMPLINPLIPAGDWRELVINTGPNDGIRIGSFLGSVVDFVIIALALYLAIRALARFKRQEELAPPEPTEQECPYCLTKIHIAATRCPACTSELSPQSPIIS